MINFDDYANENKTTNNQKWPYIPDHPYKILIVGSGSRKTHASLNLINNQLDNDKYLYAKDPYEAKYQYLINQREKVSLRHYRILKHSLNIRMMCKIFMNIFKNTK